MATSVELLNDLIAISLTSDDAVDRKRAAKLVPVVRQDLSAEDRALCEITGMMGATMLVQVDEEE